MNSANIKNTGLRGITIATTKISDVNGALGKLIYRGYLVKDLAENTTFEEVIYLLLYERLPGIDELEEFTKKINSESDLPDGIIQAMKAMPKESLPMDVLQACISLLSNYEDDVTSKSRDIVTEMAIRLISKTSSIVATWQRIRNDEEPIKADPKLNHASNFLYMVSGKYPSKEVSHFFDTCLVLHAEHSFNASTFSAREVASTRAHIYSAVSAAVGSLSGELHGGANQRVMEMLQKIDSVENVDNYIENELAEGRKVMGLGHAVYQVDDPRALILIPMSKRMGELAGETKWYEMSQLLEKNAKYVFKKKKNMDIYVNVDFYSASLYHSMGIPVDLFTPIFAVSRVSGWVAHVLEEQFAEAAPKPVLYRPESEYIGDYCGPAECLLEDLEDR